jgi:rhodanese-related sulfurtransferase
MKPKQNRLMKLFKLVFIGIASTALIVGCTRSTTPTEQGSSEQTSPSTEEAGSSSESSTSSGEDASSAPEPSGSSEETAAQVRNIDAEEASQLVEKNAELVVLDVRTPEEYREGHIAGAKNLDFHASDFEKQLSQLDKDKPYLVHCASGGRSSNTREMMKSFDFTQIYHLDGGFNAWKEAGKPVEE